MIDKKKLAGVILAGMLTVAGATSAFAADVSTTEKAVGQKQFFRFDKTELSAKVKTALDSLVSAGTITQAQADAAVKAYTPGEGRGMLQDKLQVRFMNPMEGLVTAGTITQAQADAFTAELKSSRADVLKKMVTAGTITQAQSDAISNGFEAGVEYRMQMHKGALNGNMPDIKRPFTGNLDELVSAGTITQAQADSIDAAIKSALNPLDKQ